MVRDQIQARGIESLPVLEAMRKVPRHRFVPAALASAAYLDRPLPIGYQQTISQPYIVAFMSELLELEPGHKILEIGTGSGYQAAVLAQLGARVFTIEIVEALGLQTRRLLAGLGYPNIQTRIGDGYRGWPEQAPFDRILLTAAPDKIPQALIDQLRPGGRLVAPVGPLGGPQQMILLEKDTAGNISRRSLLPVLFVPMVSQPPEPD